MATKKTPSTKKAPEAKARVTRIRATETNTSKTQTKTEKPAPSTKQATDTKAPRNTFSPRKIGRPFVRIGGYFKGAWQELREVRWPNRRATWSMTGALLGFTAFVVTLVLLLDALFKYIFELILQ